MDLIIPVFEVMLVSGSWPFFWPLLTYLRDMIFINNQTPGVLILG